MNELNLGTINPPIHDRDAIHIAVIQMVCGQDWMNPGDHVAIMPGTTNTIIRRDPTYGENGQIGVIDPFITDYSLKAGARVWVYLYPNTINGLRHNWQHPVIDSQAENNSKMSESELWLRRFAAEWNFNYDDLIEVASNAATADWSYIVAMGRDLHSASELGEDHDKFWHHLEILNGKHYDEAHREKMGWSCSC